MLIWLNGPFGGGKTQTAYELCRRLPGSFVCDHEEPRLGLHRTMPTLREESFAVSKLDLCLERLQEPEFAEHVWTDQLTISQVADRVACSVGLSLTSDNDASYDGAYAAHGSGPRTSG